MDEVWAVVGSPYTWIGIGSAAFVGVWWWSMTPNTANVTLVIGVLGFAIAAFVHPWIGRQPFLVRLLWTLALLAVTGLSAYYTLWQAEKVSGAVPATATAAERPTILSMFKTDHDRTLRSTREVTATLGDGSAVKMLEQAYLDFSARAKFAGFYIPDTPMTFVLAKQLVTNVDDVFRQVEASTHIEQGHVAQSQSTKLEDLRFTGRVLIYHETALTARQQADLEDAYHQAEMAVEFVGPNHLSIRLMGNEYRK